MVVITNNNTGPAISASEPIQYTAEERGEIDKKIKQLVGNNNCQLMFFEYHTADKKYYFIHFGGNQISFTVQEITSAATEEAVKDLFSQAFNKRKHLISPANFTIIDVVYHEPIRKLKSFDFCMIFAEIRKSFRWLYLNT